VGDQALAGLFLAFTAPDAPLWYAVKRAYGTIFGNAGRRSAVRAAADVYLLPYVQFAPVREAITKLLNAVEWASSRRDDIAHGFAERAMVNGIDRGVFLQPADYNTRNTMVAAPLETSAFFDERRDENSWGGSIDVNHDLICFRRDARNQSTHCPQLLGLVVGSRSDDKSYLSVISG